MSLKSYDFRCPKCSHEFEDLSSYNDATRGVDAVPCQKCGSPATNFWKMGTKLNVRGALSDADLHVAQMTFGQEVKTREDIRRAMRERGMAEVSTKNFETMLQEYADSSDAPPTERDVENRPKEEVQRDIAMIAEMRDRIAAARDNGDLPKEGSIHQLPDAARAVAGI